MITETIMTKRLNKLKKEGVKKYINDEFNFNFDLLTDNNIIIYGCTNSIAKEFINIQNIFNIVAIFDDSFEKKSYKNIPVKKTSEIIEYKDYIAINLTFSFNAYRFFNKLSLKNNIRMFNYFEISQYFNIQSEYPYFNNILEETVNNYEQIIDLLNNLNDNLSKKIVMQHLIFRLTFDATAFLAINDNFDEQYFDIEIDDKNEIFVDGGCFDGQTTEFLLNKCTNIKKIYCFEPDFNNYKCIIDKFYYNDNLFVHNLGLWDQKTQKYFLSTSNEVSRIVDKSDIKIVLDTIDRIASDATFIKLDIEGSEMQALAGAKKTIKKNLPKLAISIYHKPNDLFEIVNQINSYTNNYKFYIRHYSDYMFDTILYGIPK